MVPVLYCGGQTEILKYEAEADGWVKTGDLKKGRYEHAVSTVQWSEIQQFCTLY